MVCFLLSLQLCVCVCVHISVLARIMPYTRTICTHFVQSKHITDVMPHKNNPPFLIMHSISYSYYVWCGVVCLYTHGYFIFIIMCTKLRTYIRYGRQWMCGSSLKYAYLWSGTQERKHTQHTQPKTEQRIRGTEKPVRYNSPRYFSHSLNQDYAMCASHVNIIYPQYGTQANMFTLSSCLSTSILQSIHTSARSKKQLLFVTRTWFFSREKLKHLTANTRTHSINRIRIG